MKLNNIYTAAFLMVLAGGCQKETVPSQEFEGKEFKVVTNVVSRAADFPINNKFILSINQSDLGETGESGDYMNQVMSNKEGAWLPNGTEPQTAWEWVDTNPAAVTAFYIPGETDYTSLTTSTEISGSVTDQSKADVLYYNETITSKSSVLDINFKHLLCMIELPKQEDITISSITIKGVKTDYKWMPNIAPASLSTEAAQTQTVTEGTTEIDEIKFVNNYNGSHYCILPPQNLNGIQLEVTYSDGSTQTETFEDTDIVSGGKYTINNFTYNPADNTATTTKARSGKAGLTLTKVGE